MLIVILFPKLVANCLNPFTNNIYIYIYIYNKNILLYIKRFTSKKC